MAKNDANIPTYYLDACVLIDLIEHPETEEPAKTIVAIMSDAEKGRFDLVTSTLTIIEVLRAKSEMDCCAIDPEVERRINSLWHPASSPIRLVEFHELIARDALSLWRTAFGKHGWTKTKGNDAAHLVTAHREGATEFFSNEGAMKKWEQYFGFKVTAPHYELPTEDEKRAKKSKIETSVVSPLESDLFSLAVESKQAAMATSDKFSGDVFWLLRQSKNRQLIQSASHSHGPRQSLNRNER